MDSNLLVVTAHPDDAEIFMGGTIIKHTSIGNVIILVEAIDNVRKSEAQEAAKILSATIEICNELNSNICEEMIIKYKADIVITHNADDFHDDHRRVFYLVTKAIKNTYIKFGLPHKYYSFDTYNSIGLNDYFKPDRIIDVSKEFDIKLKALEVHNSQPIDYFKKMAISIGKMWGQRIQTDFGEAFKSNPILGILPKSDYL